MYLTSKLGGYVMGTKSPSSSLSLKRRLASACSRDWRLHLKAVQRIQHGLQSITIDVFAKPWGKERLRAHCVVQLCSKWVGSDI